MKFQQYKSFCHIAIEVICGHLTTLLSQPNWRLRATLFDSLVTVAAYIGLESEVYIQPLLEQVRTIGIDLNGVDLFVLF